MAWPPQRFSGSKSRGPTPRRTTRHLLPGWRVLSAGVPPRNWVRARSIRAWTWFLHWTACPHASLPAQRARLIEREQPTLNTNPLPVNQASKDQVLPLVYTDGAASPDGRGGWAWTDGLIGASGSARRTTNQRMELRAVLEAVRSHDHTITVCSDSAYVINCFEQKWYLTWRQNGWKNSAGKPVSNADVWRKLIPLALARKTTFRKVKGHSGDRLNELADRLAVAAKDGIVLPGVGPISACNRSQRG